MNELELDASLAYNDIANYLDFKTKSYDLREYGIDGSITLDNVITYDESKSIKNKSFIDDINAGFCSPGYVSDIRRGWSLLFLENFRRVMTGKEKLVNEIPINLNISCLIEGSIIVKRGWFTGSMISTKREFILEGSEYKAYTCFTMGCHLSTDVDVKLVLKDSGWLNYISLVFQECIERNIHKN